MALVDRARAIVTAPAATWPQIAAEPDTPQRLFSQYVVPLALISPVCSMLSYLIFLHRGIVVGLVVGVLGFGLELVYVAVVALLAAALAPSFDGAPNRMQALKWIAYSLTPRWLAGIALLVPIAGALITLVASVFGLYLLYLGARPMMRVPQDKTVGYTAVLILCVIVLGAIIAAVIGAVVAALLVTAAVALPH